MGGMPDIVEVSDPGTGSEGGASSVTRRSASLESRQPSQARQLSGTLPGARLALGVGASTCYSQTQHASP